MITQEERNNLRQVVEYSRSGVVKVIPLPWQTVEILLNALEAEEARVLDVETSLVRAQGTISEQCAGIDKIATANRALAAKAKKAEAEVARMRAILEPQERLHSVMKEARNQMDAARQAVADGKVKA